MQSLINKLFNGNTMPESEKLIDSKPFKRNTALDNADKKERELLKTFNDEQKKLFDEWRFFSDGIWSDEVDLAYERGFKTGALLMTEIYDIQF